MRRKEGKEKYTSAEGNQPTAGIYIYICRIYICIYICIYIYIYVGYIYIYMYIYVGYFYPDGIVKYDGFFSTPQIN
jgi:hypothetical protein